MLIAMILAGCGKASVGPTATPVPSKPVEMTVLLEPTATMTVDAVESDPVLFDDNFLIPERLLNKYIIPAAE
jgi:hypothetical protein